MFIPVRTYEEANKHKNLYYRDPTTGFYTFTIFIKDQDDNYEQDEQYSEDHLLHLEYAPHIIDDDGNYQLRKNVTMIPIDCIYYKKEMKIY